MRLWVKLLVIVAIAVGTQWLILSHEQEIDDAQFAARCFVGKLCGRGSTDEELMGAAEALLSRNSRRIERRMAVAACATTRPAEVRAAPVSVADELEWSLACSPTGEAR